MTSHMTEIIRAPVALACVAALVLSGCSAFQRSGPPPERPTANVVATATATGRSQIDGLLDPTQIEQPAPVE